MPTLNRTTGDATTIAVIALAVRLPAFFAPQPLSFDDGQFAMSVIAMRHGGVPFREVFSSQGPLFLPIAWLGDLFTFQRLDSPRTAAVLSGVALAVLAFLIAGRLSSRSGARLAGFLVALRGSVLWTTGPLTSDGIAAAITAAAGLAALAYIRAPSARRAILIGVLAGAALAVKSLLVLPGLLAAGLWVLGRRRWRDITLVPLVAGVVVVLLSLPWGLARVYDQYVRYHTDAIADRPFAANASKLTKTLFERDAPLLAAAAVALLATLALLLRRRSGAPTNMVAPAVSPIPSWYPLAVWFFASLAVILTESPMWRNHVAHVAVPLALLVGVACARRRIAVAAAIAAVLLAPISVVHLTELLRPKDYAGADAIRQQLLADLPRGALVISDTSGDVWRAGRRVPDEFVDVSILRITSPTPSLRLTEQHIVTAAARPDVCAVVRWSHLRFQNFPNLGPRLRAAGYRAAFADRGSPRVVWIKQDCRPGARADPKSAAAAPGRSPG